MSARTQRQHIDEPDTRIPRQGSRVYRRTVALRTAHRPLPNLQRRARPNLDTQFGVLYRARWEDEQLRVGLVVCLCINIVALRWWRERDRLAQHGDEVCCARRVESEVGRKGMRRKEGGEEVRGRDDPVAGEDGCRLALLEDDGDAERTGRSAVGIVGGGDGRSSGRRRRVLVRHERRLRWGNRLSDFRRQVEGEKRATEDLPAAPYRADSVRQNGQKRITCARCDSQLAARSRPRGRPRRRNARPGKATARTARRRESSCAVAGVRELQGLQVFV